MPTYTLIVDPDGFVRIPGTRPGQTITVRIEPDAAASQPPVSELSPEEQERIIQYVLERGRRFREEADPEWRDLDHGDWLYGPDGLPR